jgi:hypothetical protein
LAILLTSLGFSNSDNNGSGSAGGGGNSYFVTNVTALVMTVSDPNGRLVNEGPVGSLTLQLDHGDGQYRYYKNGVLVAQQANMVLPGLYDFSTSNTTLSLGESYSKLIWHDPISTSAPNCVGDCKSDGCERMGPPFGNGTGTFTGTCRSAIGGGACGYQFLPYGWNGSGLTRSTSGGSFDTHISCDATWSGPMPTPPVFNRYLDDIIVLSSNSANPIIQAATLAASTDACSNPQQTVTFPGFAKFTLDSGTVATCGAAGTSGQGINSYFDLKNDQNALWDFGAADTGMFEHQWGIKNQDGTTRYNEIKEGPMAITVAESNNVRVKLTQSGAVRSVGLLSNAADCCMTMTKSYVFYRDGVSGASTGASKVFTKTTINYNNGDSQAPLTTAGTSTGINYYDKMGYWKVSGEVNNQSNPGPCSSSLQPFTLSPWNILWPGTQLDNTVKNYILYSPVNANDSNATEFLPGAPCTSPGNVNPGPENTSGIQPGTIMLCNGASSSGCTSQSPSPAIVRANFLQIENEQTCSFMSIGTQNYFLGGLRTYCALANQTFPTNTPRSWTSVGFIGDNGITSTSAADSYSTEYKTPPTLTFTVGSGGTFDPVEGYWTIAASGNQATFSTGGTLHSPAFLISSFSGAVPSSIVVSGVAFTLNSRFVAEKTDSTHLLLQVLGTFNSGTTFDLSSASLTVSPNTAAIPVLGTQQFSSSTGGATWTAPGCSGSVSAGFFTASSTPEVCSVVATVGTASGSAQVTVGAFTVTPSTVSLQVGATQQFLASFPAAWSTDGGTIDTTSGAYIAPTLNGTYHVTATAKNGGATATATITVTGQPTFIPLSISPLSWAQTTAINTTITKTFTVSNIGTGSVTPTVSLTGSGKFSLSANTCTGAVSGGSTCSITAQFVSTTVGAFSANINVADTAGGNTNLPLSVNIPTGTTVSLSPSSANLPKSGTLQFSASTSNGSSVTYTALRGSINSSGFYTAPNTAGTDTVTASATDGSGSSQSANLTIGTMTISPSPVTLQVNAAQTFTTNFLATFTASCGTINATTGRYVAPAAPTTCTVTATASNGGTTATSTVTVVAVPVTNPGGKVKGGKGKPGTFH